MMRPEVKPPVRPASHLDRALDCEEAIEPGLMQLVAAAEAAGWDRAEIWPALISVAVNQIKADIENDRLEADLRTARIARLLFPDG
ncbi:hypothetical protein EMQ25_00770 [Arsenicitalea aurantiaca]|uniref:Uncharacterized protein n=1 Tax=Arsenicitalea aurantiaca TaxID=1783274 RepID=A0A433XKD2_9HYPH|nr:hypothetical protein [Arsenicitalea aurantiaca]RUT34529.1 hypothetical protein EMQ25_00770 [Arsenicitalea aurantiaca]